jgi:hypothetical protein
VHVLELELAGESVQVVELKVPPLPPSFQLTVPVGAEAVPRLVSTTVAVKVIGEKLPIVSEAEPGETVVVVALRTERDDLPELTECCPSPE